MQPTADEVGPSAKSKGNKKGGKNVSRAKRGNRKTYGIQSRFFFILGSVGVVVILINVYVFTGGVLGPAKRPRPIVPGIVWKKDESPHHLSSTRLDKRNNNENSKDGDKDGKERVVQILQEATIQVNTSMRERLPTWEQVTRIVGEHPIIVYNNAESSCAAFRQRVPAVQRMLGSAGMFSTGTNLVTTLLKNNCQIPERVELYGPHASREDHGMRWQVPWGKHTPAHYKYEHVAKIAKNVNKEDILPVVTIRNPYQWMKSMCKNPYTAKWNHRRDQCPNLLSSDKNKNNNMNDPNAWNTVSVKYGAGTETYQSLAHLFNDWYNEYLQNASYPWIMIRMEDLVFHTKETVTTVCECAGGRIRQDRPFVYTVDSAKADSPGHDTSVGFFEAWVRYSQAPEVLGGFSERDYQAAKSVLDEHILQLFHFEHPPTSR